MGTKKAVNSETAMYHLSRPILVRAITQDWKGNRAAKLTQMDRVVRETNAKHQIDRDAGDEVVDPACQSPLLIDTAYREQTRHTRPSSRAAST